MAGGAGVSFHQFIRDGEEWKTLATDVKYANPFAQFWTVNVRTPSRPEGVDWTVVHRKGAAVVAPITAEGHFVLVRQERIPIRATIWEFPAGQIEENSEHDVQTIRATALRELREESGHELAPGGELIRSVFFFHPPVLPTSTAICLLLGPSCRANTVTPMTKRRRSRNVAHFRRKNFA
jgi:8-oxo-dGTP pyrophosphatase MutT (NUDIX family)